LEFFHTDFRGPAKIVVYFIYKQNKTRPSGADFICID
jgi:hypothetical protein